MKNRIKTFVKNHDIEIATAAAFTGVAVLSLAYLSRCGEVIALRAKLQERGKPLNFTFTDEFIDKLYETNHKD